jgi:hypothetical protein
LSDDTFPWQDTSPAPRERARPLVEAMTLEQKIADHVGDCADDSPHSATITVS